MTFPGLDFEIAKLCVKAGDVLVLKCDDHISEEQAKRLRSILQPHLPEGVKMMILDRSVTLSVLSREEIESKAA